MIPPLHLWSTWAEIDLDSIGHNVNEFLRLIGPQVRIMAVVKADGYGHGAVETARAALAAGASHLAVALLEEGIELRRAGIEAPVLLFGYTDPAQAPALLEYGITPTLFDPETAGELSRRVASEGARIPVHVKVDTGMGRVGVSPGGAVDFIANTARLPGLDLEGVLTHFAAADEEGSPFTESQLRLFDGILEACRERGINPPLLHAANSAAAAACPHSRYNLVRLGIALYGCYPGRWLSKGPVRLEAALSLKSRIIFLKEVPPGTPIGYGCTYRTAERTVVATVPAGYADGFPRGLSNRGQVLVRGRRVPVIGRICMDQFMIDVSRVSGAARGDEVVLYGAQGGERITVEEAAETLGTISYELLCAVGKRVPRLYLREGRPVAVRNLLGGNIFNR